MARLSEALLQSSSEGASHKGVLRGLAAASALVSGCMLFFAGAEFGRATPHESQAFGVSLNGLNRSSLRASPTSLAAGLAAECYTFTGVSCVNEPCGAERNAECEDSNCMCVTTGCAGLDGACHAGTYKVVASGFILYNNKYSWQHMYMPPMDMFNRIKVTLAPSAFMLRQDKFTLHEIPVVASKPKAYFLSDDAYPEYALTIKPTSLLEGLSPYGVFSAALSDEKSPSFYAVRVCSMGDGKIKIGSYKEPVEWFYVHHGSWVVYGWGLTKDPGSGGHWSPSPSIPEGTFDKCD